MGGEVVFKILSVKSDHWFVRPDKSYGRGNDLSMKTEDGWFHICGDNDWGYLALQLLEPIYKEAEKILAAIDNSIKVSKSENNNIRIIELGRNDKRIMDIRFGGKDKCTQINGIPVIVKDDVENHIGYLIDYEAELPFV